jgi:hypothetical protein
LLTRRVVAALETSANFRGQFHFGDHLGKAS